MQNRILILLLGPTPWCCQGEVPADKDGIPEKPFFQDKTLILSGKPKKMDP
jgi:hypothetical protein